MILQNGLGAMGATPFMKNLLGGLGTGLAGGIMNKINPEPRPLTGAQEGQKQKEYFSTLYDDKLNPWELAGAGGHGVGGTSAPNAAGLQARKTQREQLNQQNIMQQNEMQNKKDIAQISADATVQSAKIGAGMTANEEPNSMRENQIREIDAKITKMQSETDINEKQSKILDTAVAIRNEIQAMMENIKDGNPTMLKKAENMVEEARKIAGSSADKAIDYLKKAWDWVKKDAQQGVDWLKRDFEQGKNYLGLGGKSSNSAPARTNGDIIRQGSKRIKELSERRKKEQGF